VNLTILVITSACITAFVFDKPLTSLWAASGVLTLVLGLALQSLIMDAFGGLMLSAERPFKIGDWIMVAGRNRASSPVGRVEEMNWRTTRLWTLDNNLLVIPNSAIAQATVENYSAPSRPSRLQVPVVLGFKVPVERAVTVLGEAARRAVGEGGLLPEPEPTVVVERVEPEGIRYQVQGYHDVGRVSAEVATTRTIAAMAAYLESLDMPLGLPGNAPSGQPETPVVLTKQAPVQATGSPR
jgi:small-conductance mechanosensitive channel